MKTKLRAIVEGCNWGRLSETAYFINGEGAGDTLDKCFDDLKRWFPEPFKVGKGGSHVWVHWMEKRILLVRQQEVQP